MAAESRPPDAVSPNYKGPDGAFPFRKFRVVGAVHLTLALGIQALALVQMALGPQHRDILLRYAGAPLWCPIPVIAVAILGICMTRKRYWEVRCMKSTFGILSLLNAFVFMTILGALIGLYGYWYYNIIDYRPPEAYDEYRLDHRPWFPTLLLSVQLVLAAAEVLLAIGSFFFCFCCAQVARPGEKPGVEALPLGAAVTPGAKPPPAVAASPTVVLTPEAFMLAAAAIGQAQRSPDDRQEHRQEPRQERQERPASAGEIDVRVHQILAEREAAAAAAAVGGKGAKGAKGGKGKNKAPPPPKQKEKKSKKKKKNQEGEATTKAEEAAAAAAAAEAGERPPATAPAHNHLYPDLSAPPMYTPQAPGFPGPSAPPPAFGACNPGYAPYPPPPDASQPFSHAGSS